MAKLSKKIFDEIVKPFLVKKDGNVHKMILSDLDAFINSDEEFAYVGLIGFIINEMEKMKYEVKDIELDAQRRTLIVYG